MTLQFNLVPFVYLAAGGWVLLMPPIKRQSIASRPTVAPRRPGGLSNSSIQTSQTVFGWAKRHGERERESARESERHQMTPGEKNEGQENDGQKTPGNGMHKRKRMERPKTTRSRVLCQRFDLVLGKELKPTTPRSWHPQALFGAQACWCLLKLSCQLINHMVSTWRLPKASKHW